MPRVQWSGFRVQQSASTGDLASCKVLNPELGALNPLAAGSERALLAAFSECAYNPGVILRFPRSALRSGDAPLPHVSQHRSAGPQRAVAEPAGAARTVPAGLALSARAVGLCQALFRLRGPGAGLRGRAARGICPRRVRPQRRGGRHLDRAGHDLPGAGPPRLRRGPGCGGARRTVRAVSAPPRDESPLRRGHPPVEPLLPRAVRRKRTARRAEVRRAGQRGVPRAGLQGNRPGGGSAPGACRLPAPHGPPPDAGPPPDDRRGDPRSPGPNLVGGVSSSRPGSAASRSPGQPSAASRPPAPRASAAPPG